jgi:alkylhydroperoxidase family enzyme
VTRAGLSDATDRRPVSDIKRLRDLQPDSTEKLVRLNQTMGETVDPELFKLCTDRVHAMIERSGAEPPGNLDARQRAYLEFTEQFVTSVGTISDAQVDALLAEDSPEDVYAFAGALYAAEMTRRAEIVSKAVLG